MPCLMIRKKGETVMKTFMDQDFLLTTPTARTLYHDYAKGCPIFDFHCHLPVQEIYEDRKFANLTEAWLGGDHYKWRLLREMGVEEGYVTGNKPDYEKFMKYAEMLPYAIGNPMYHWTHMELRHFFGIYDLLSPKTAEKIYAKAEEKLKTLSARQMILMSNVTKIVTTDDPTDDLKYHKLLAQDDSFPVDVLPGFRPDKALNIEAPLFVGYIKKLGEASHIDICDLDSLCLALSARIAYFDACGCVCSDHGLEIVMYEEATKEEVNALLCRALAGEKITSSQAAPYKTYILHYLGKEYAKLGWVQQYHIGALRNNSSRRFAELGPDTGFDAMGDRCFAENLSALLDALDRENNLPKTILYCLNPRDNEVLATLKNCFAGGGIVSRVQYGSAWWFNDQKDGIEKQLTALSQVGLLSKFVGMLTDSRSFLSYPRHEYFRRILCNLLGNLIENGEYPPDIEFVGGVVKDICYHNAMAYFAK